MTILLSLLGVHIVNTLFIFFTVARIATKCDIDSAYNVHYLLWLLRHPVLNCFALASIFINGEEGLVEICKDKMKRD